MKYRAIIILAVSYLLFVSCGDVPIFTEMDTNRLKIVIKGTFETEDVSGLTPMPSLGNDQLILSGSIVNGEFDEAGSLPETLKLPTRFMFDIAELRLNGKKFANYRQVMEASLSGDGSAEAFFNGRGIVLENDDPAEGYYDTVQIYVRKMIFDGGNIYSSSGNSFEPAGETRVIFSEKNREGFDFNQYQQNTYVDSLKLNSSDYLRSFPINIPIIGGLQYDKNEKETVLEIRIVVKNFIKKYELSYYDLGVLKLYHFYALSDWLREVQAGERVLGGNILAVARAYVPGKTGRVTVNAGSGQYVIAIPASEDIGDYFMNRIPGDETTGARGFDYDLPQSPSYQGDNIEALLDYYIKYEKYKNDCNNKLTSTTQNFDDYGIAWDEYDSAVNKFKIAPYVGYTGTGTTVTFSNMAAPDEYKFYTTSKPSLYGGLFEGSPPAPIATITVDIGDDITIP
ncbi:MAG: hypothetical protein FWH53_06800 [Leptospirales bacterium]|nr:hypothetical protein [Leptospirales bacterium]